MKSFNVLDRELNIHQHCLLEASAGTGKTFSIENIVVRLLIEKEGLPIENILVVTFTKIATRDLKSRIRTNIEKNLFLLKKDPEFLPDYLKALVEEGKEKCVIKQLEKALFCFDQAQIFTIHGFCARMLKNYVFECDLGVNSIASEEQMANSDVLRIIRDHFRVGVKEEILSSGQLKILLKRHKGDIKKLEKAIFRTITGGFEISQSQSFEEYFERFSCVMSSFKYRAQQIVEDFEAQVGSYRKIGDYEEILDKVKAFAQLFEQANWTFKDFDLLINDGLLFLQALDENLLKVRAKSIDPSLLHYPGLKERLLKELYPIVEEASQYGVIFGRICHDCQKLLQKNLIEEENFRFDDLLKNMFQALKNDEFINKVRKQYACAIIDEFQDTDPLQWEIFKTLFLNSGTLYLVGDPKQSIYGFRQADIYTYLAAANLLGKDHKMSLTTNYRSQPSLVHSLNQLFQVSDFIQLPKIRMSLEYPQVNASKNNQERLFSDSLGSLHFCITKLDSKSRGYPLIELEEDYYFPYILEEIQRLHRFEKINYPQFAILVRDHFQATRIGNFLKKFSVPIVLQKSTSLADSLALSVMKELLKTLLSPRDESLLKIVLAGPLFRWNEEKIKQWDSNQSLQEKVVRSFFELQHALFHQGFGSCYRLLMESISEKLLEEKESLNFYQDLEQIAQLLMEHECQFHVSPERLLEFLDQFDFFDEDEEAIVKRGVDPDKQAVQILTLHSSKGLEFEIVFALGLINRTPMQADLIPNDQQVLVPMYQLSHDVYQCYCDECDAEKMRQLYVTLTRAKWRLYVPAILGLNLPELGTASPMELYLNKIKQPLETFLEDRHISFEILNERKFLEDYSSDNSEAITLTPPSQIVVPGQSLFISSFSHLTKNKIGEIKENIPHSFHSEVKNRHTLPSGNKTGILFHSILENISFHNPLTIQEWVKKILLGTEFDEWKEVFIETIENVLSFSLFDGRRHFCLKELDPHRQYREMEFIYSCEESMKYQFFAASDGFLKGVIDLIFEYEGKYYLVDWKSNWLGPSIENYDQMSLYQAMQENDYFLQANIYKTALKRFLGIVDERDFEDCFGGIFYFFLRGVDLEKCTGVYFFR